ncbi:SCO2521 family protein [Luedemannella helvata]|uniref:SCO2521 family protein n=1 Tax=Luedemannella helvata TaxID=349315 RepID=A0ABP4WSG1_9ACTN
MLILGEVHTGLLQNSTAVAQDDAAAILDVVLGERVRRSERPIAYAVSPERLTGVDCRLPTGTGSRTRAVGTVASRAAITAGHVLQGSAFAVVEPGREPRRRAWSHYLARPGQLETIGKVDLADLRNGQVRAAESERSLDLGAIAGRAMDGAQRSGLLDRRAPLRTQRTRLRWLAWRVAAEAPVSTAFSVESDTVRTLVLGVPDVPLAAVVDLCEDLALHDWLLTTMISYVDRRITATASPAERVAQLRPAIDHLLHLWMPAARVAEPLLPVWESLERRPGFTRQWDTSVSRIRDQVSLSAVLTDRAGR